MMTLLLIDDESWMLELLPEKLREAGIVGTTVKILTARTPEEALAHAEVLGNEAEGARVTVLADYNLGTDVDGIELLKEIGRRLPRAMRVLMSGQPPESFADQMDGAGLDGFFEKPMEFQAWVPMVQGILAHRSRDGRSQDGRSQPLES